MEVFNEIEDILDNELINLVNPQRKAYTVPFREDNIDKWTDNEFLQRYRLSKNTVLRLLENIKERLQHRTDR